MQHAACRWCRQHHLFVPYVQRGGTAVGTPGRAQCFAAELGVDADLTLNVVMIVGNISRAPENVATVTSASDFNTANDTATAIPVAAAPISRTALALLVTLLATAGVVALRL